MAQRTATAVEKLASSTHEERGSFNVRQSANDALYASESVANANAYPENKVSGEILSACMQMEVIVNQAERMGVLPKDIVKAYKVFLHVQRTGQPGERDPRTSFTPMPVNDVKEIEQTIDYLKHTFEEAKQKAAELEKMIEEIGGKNVQFLKKKLIFTGEHNFNDGPTFGKLKEAVKKKVERIKRDQALYEKCYNDELVENGFLQITASKSIQMKDKKEFLELTVPERRKMIKEYETALREAREFRDGQDERYHQILNPALAKRWISRKSYRDLWKGKYDKTGKIKDKGFEKVDVLTREDYIVNHETVLGLRRDLRENIDQMKGGAKAWMEKMFELVGFSTLSQMYERDQEIQRDYIKALDGLKKRGIIGEKTHSEYSEWIERQPFPLKKEAFPLLFSYGQMGRFEELHKRIDDLTDEQKLELEMHHDEWGYTKTKEFMEQAKRENQRGQGEDGAFFDTDDPTLLKGITRTSVRERVIDGLSSLGKIRFKKLAVAFKRVYGSEGQRIKTMNSFEKTVAKGRATVLKEEEGLISKSPENESLKVVDMQLRRKQQHQKAHPELADEQGSVEVVDFSKKIKPESVFADTEENIDVLEQAEGAEVIELDGFRKVEFDDDGDEETAIHVDWNTEQGMDAFAREAHNIQEDNVIKLSTSIGSKTEDLTEDESEEVAKAVHEIYRKVG